VFIFLWIFSATELFAYESGDVVFSEIMYDVPSTDAGYEWIEIWNMSDAVIDFSEWFIFENNVAHRIDPHPESTSDCKVPSGDYLVITSNAEKFTNRWDDVSNEQICDTVISLNNSGERIELFAPTESVIDSIEYAPHESASGTGFSLQFDGSVWDVGDATPGTQAVFGLPSTDIQDQNENDGQEQQNDPQSQDQTQDTLVLDPEEYYESKRDHPEYFNPYYVGELIAPDIAYYGMPLEFSMDIFFHKFGDDVTQKNKGLITWSFGDAVSQTLDWNDPVAHIYHAPGTYIVYASYQTGYSSSKRLEFKKHITVHDAPIEIVHIDQAGTVTLHNTAAYEIDLSFWEIQYGISLFQIPGHTYIPAGEKRVIDRRIHKLPINYYALTPVELWMPERYKQIALVRPLDTVAIPISDHTEKVSQENIEVQSTFVDQNEEQVIEKIPDVVAESIDYTSLLTSIQSDTQFAIGQKNENSDHRESQTSWLHILLLIYCVISSIIGYVLYRRMWIISDEEKDMGKRKEILEQQKSTDSEVLLKYLRGS